MTAEDLSAVERREAEKAINVLFVGMEITIAKGSFKRKEETIRFDHAALAKDAIDMLVARDVEHPFDCVIIDMRGEDAANPLNVVAIAALRAARRCVVLSKQDDAEIYGSLMGVHDVLCEPIKPKAIIATVLASRSDVRIESENMVSLDEKRTLEPEADQEAGASAQGRPDVPVEPEVPAVEVATAKSAQPTETKSMVTKGFEASISKIAEADQGLWRRFVPVANFAYKKLAVVILTALFLTFLTYGAMIVFFMGSSSWSLPFELSRGHALVDKTERDLSSMRLRANQVRQDLKSASVELSAAQRDKRDGQLQLDLMRRTIDEEILLQNYQQLEITKNIARLKRVIADFNKLNGQGTFAKNLEGAYAKRLITRKALNSSTLAVLETLHRIATVENEIAQRQLELNKVNRRLEFLLSLRQEIDKPEITVITSAGSDMAHLARDVILAKTQIFNAGKQEGSAKLRVAQLENSLGVITANLTSLEKTPAARALDAPVMVLFVPYTNTDQVLEGEKLVGCRFTLIVCSAVGTIGGPISGETTAVHPLFGKPLRGKFMEANFYDPRSVTQEIVHAKRAPMFF
ncbi:hypothetical protein ACFQ14_07480 [Pseudahrensia aquimaris]|uniref:Response regulatory domain-containing protein n=1 Tax=Pseudahrensia aquimaris TaxID=744461 RepID=A0ABW3FIP7_9HYPH